MYIYKFKVYMNRQRLSKNLAIVFIYLLPASLQPQYPVCLMSGCGCVYVCVCVCVGVCVCVWGCGGVYVYVCVALLQVSQNKVCKYMCQSVPISILLGNYLSRGTIDFKGVGWLLEDFPMLASSNTVIKVWWIFTVQ